MKSDQIRCFCKKFVILQHIWWFFKSLYSDLVFKYSSARFDRKFNIQTTEKLDRTELDVPSEKRLLSWSYHALDIGRFERIMRSFDLDLSNYVFLDVGSGKGRVLFMADQLQPHFNRIIGVEFSKILNETARRNLLEYKKKTGSRTLFELVHCDALDYEFPGEPSVVCLFNPFIKEVMVKFLYNLQNSIEKCPRDLFLIYIHPTAESAFREFGCFTKVYENRGKDDFILYRARTSGL